MNAVLRSPRLDGCVRAPASKSEAHRLLITAALAALYGAAPTCRRVRCTDLNDDIEATVRCLRALGATIIRDGDNFMVTPIISLPQEALLDCGESGSTLRFLLPVACALGATAGAPDGFTVSLVGHGRLPERPLSPLYEELILHGAQLSPIGTHPLVVRGGLTSGDYTIDGGVSSQFISGLLFALPLLEGESTLLVTGRIESAPYIDMTTDALAQITGSVTGSGSEYRIRRTIHRTIHRAATGDLPCATGHGEAPNGAEQGENTAVSVGGDWSGAAFWLTAGVLTPPGGSVSVTGLDPASRQGDRAIVDLLRRMGGRIECDDRAGSGVYTAHASSLRGCVIDATHVPDLVPILAVAAAVAEGETRIIGAARLRLKESDRLVTVHDLLTALGADVTITADGLIIRGGVLHGGLVDAAGDHRIAMSAAIAATRVQNDCALADTSDGAEGRVTLVGAEAVAKSYPAFWRDYASLMVSGTVL